MCEEELASGALTELLTGYVIDPGAIPGFVFGGNERLTTLLARLLRSCARNFSIENQIMGIRKTGLHRSPGHGVCIA